MIRFLVVVLGLVWAFPALAQQRVVIQNGTTAVSNSNPLPVTASITPSGTQNVNLTQILGAAPSLTNPLWVFPATGATFPVSGTVAVTQSTSPWIVAGGGTAGSAASGVLTIQGIASMTPVQVSQATAANLNATVVGTGTFAVQATLSAETTKVIGTVNQGTSPWVTSTTLPTTPTVAAGNGVISAPSSEALAAIAHSTSVTTAESCRVLKNSPGNLYSVRVSIAATTGYVMVFDATSAPGDGAVTTLAIPAVRVVSDGTSGWYSDDFNPPMRMATGITVCFSSTGPFSKTASATAAIEGQVQ